MEWDSPEHLRALSELKGFRQELSTDHCIAQCVLCRATIDVRIGRHTGRQVSMHPKAQFFNRDTGRFEACKYAGHVEVIR